MAPTVKKQRMNKKWSGAITFQALLLTCFLQQGSLLKKVPQPLEQHHQLGKVVTHLSLWETFYIQTTIMFLIISPHLLILLYANHRILNSKLLLLINFISFHILLSIMYIGTSYTSWSILSIFLLHWVLKNSNIRFVFRLNISSDS